MIPIHINIGSIKTIDVRNWKVVPDSRQTMIQTIGDNIVQDFGRIPSGDKITCAVTIFIDDAQTLANYADLRQKVDIVDEAGITHHNMRVLIKGYSYVRYFATNAMDVDLEFWPI